MGELKFPFPQGLTFDDVLLLPGFSDFRRSDIDLSANLTKKIRLDLPLISAPMDTVTEAKLAIELARLGGIGIIHRNFSIARQVAEVAKVKRQKLLVGAAIGAASGYKDRVKTLVSAKTDVIVVDNAHGFAAHILETVRFIKKTYPGLQVIAGNIATAEGARALAQAGADGLRVGMGPGSICTTRVISGMGVPQISAVLATAREAKKFKVPVIADGGIKNSGDIVKALGAGASSVMLGSMLAGTKETPGNVINLSPQQVPSRFRSILNNRAHGYKFKKYRGMGSVPAMKKGAAVKAEDEFHGKDYSQRTLVAEGVEGLTPYKGTVEEVTEQIIGGLRSGFYYIGAKSINELWQKADFAQITQASLSESHPHDILVTDPGQNYL